MSSPTNEQLLIELANRLNKLSEISAAPAPATARLARMTKHGRVGLELLESGRAYASFTIYGSSVWWHVVEDTLEQAIEALYLVNLKRGMA